MLLTRYSPAMDPTPNDSPCSLPPAAGPDGLARLVDALTLYVRAAGDLDDLDDAVRHVAVDALIGG